MVLNLGCTHPLGVRNVIPGGAKHASRLEYKVTKDRMSSHSCLLFYLFVVCTCIIKCSYFPAYPSFSHSPDWCRYISASFLQLYISRPGSSLHGGGSPPSPFSLLFPLFQNGLQVNRCFFVARASFSHFKIWSGCSPLVNSVPIWLAVCTCIVSH